MPEIAEKALMTDLVGTYGKTFHTWQVDRGDKIPLGIPQLMMGFTDDGQARKEMTDARNKGYGVSTDEKRKNRMDIPAKPVAPGADAWSHGDAVQTDLQKVEPKRQP